MLKMTISNTAIFLAILTLGCNTNLKRKKHITDEAVRQELASVTDRDLIPHYRQLYTQDSTNLENVDLLLTGKNIDQLTCLKIITNSCKELKANYNNYLLDSYGTLAITGDRLPYLDIGNVARFIVWKFKLNDTV